MKQVLKFISYKDALLITLLLIVGYWAGYLTATIGYKDMDARFKQKFENFNGMVYDKYISPTGDTLHYRYYLEIDKAYIK